MINFGTSWNPFPTGEFVVLWDRSQAFAKEENEQEGKHPGTASNLKPLTSPWARVRFRKVQTN